MKKRGEEARASGVLIGVSLVFVCVLEVGVDYSVVVGGLVVVVIFTMVRVVVVVIVVMAGAGHAV